MVYNRLKLHNYIVHILCHICQHIISTRLLHTVSIAQWEGLKEKYKRGGTKQEIK